MAILCNHIGCDCGHHNASEEAKASGEVILAAMRKSGLDLNAMLKRGVPPIDPSAAGDAGSIKRDGNPDGPLSGEIVVLTDAQETPSREAADLAALISCVVWSVMTKKTTLLDGDNPDVARLACHSKSSKHLKAAEMAAQEMPIRIVRETDFPELVNQA